MSEEGDDPGIVGVLLLIEEALNQPALRWWSCHACGCLINDEDPGCPSCKAWLLGLVKTEDEDVSD